MKEKKDVRNYDLGNPKDSRALKKAMLKNLRY